MKRSLHRAHRLGILALVLTLLVGLVPDALAQGPIADAEVVTAALNMRAAPTTSAPILQELSIGTLLTVLARNADGTWLLAQTPAGVSGWVKAGWLALRLDLDIPALPYSETVIPVADQPPVASAPAAQSAAPAAPPAAAGPSTAGAGASVVTRVNIRSGPGTAYRYLGTLDLGVQLTLQGRDSTGFWVYGAASTGHTGWVAARYTDVALATVSGLPVLDASAPTNVPAAPAAPAAAPAPAQPIPAAAGPSTAGTAAATTNRVNIRTGPSTNNQRLGTLDAGTPMTLQGRNAASDWVYGATSSGYTGWVAAVYTSASPVVIAGLPVLDASAPTGVPAPAAAPASGALPAPAVAAGATSGFMLGGQVADFTQQGWMQSAGMTWVKRQVTYNNGANPGDQAGLIADAHNRGFRILLSVKGHPGELAADPNYISNFAGYLGGLAAQGADAIEVWNEMNIDREWPTGRIDPGWYTQMLAASYNAIKANNGGTMVISGAPAPTGAEGAFGSSRVWNDDRYIRGMAAAGAASYMDCVGVHYNEGIIPPGQRSGDPRGGHYTRYFWGMVDLYSGAFGGSRPLCFTELGYLSPEGYGTLPGSFAWAQNVSVAQQAQWLADAARLSRSSGRVRLLIVWNVDFTGRWGDDPMGGYAIVRPGGDCPACRALAGIW